MPKILTEKQVHQYHEDGFISPIDVMSEEEAKSYKNKLEEVERNFPEEIHAESRNNLHLSFQFLDELAHHPIIVGAIEDLIGPNISLWASVMFIKEPSTKHYVSWHQDATYMGMNSNNFATPWIALSPSNLETGCMTMIPGSHKNHIREHEDTYEENNILTRGQVVKDIDSTQGIDLILRPGQMSIHNGEVVHGSQPNQSQERRIGFALQSYMPTNVRQEVGQNIWMHVQGEKRQDPDLMLLNRPQFDMDPKTVAERKIADENLAKILYKGAKIKRKY